MSLLDLAKFKCAHLMLEGILAVPNGPAFFNRVVGRRITPKTSYQCEESYNASGGFHTVTATIERRQRAYGVEMHFDCTLGEEGTASEKRDASKLLEALSELNVATTYSYDIVFEFGRDATQRFFPLKLPILTGAAIDEFRGFRGVKHQGGRVAYRLSIESPDLKELYINVEVSYREKLSLASLERRLQEAASIARGIVPTASE
jgi:hypothetical protein